MIIENIFRILDINLKNISYGIKFKNNISEVCYVGK